MFIILLCDNGVFERIATDKALKWQVLLIRVNLVLGHVFVRFAFALLLTLQLPAEFVI